MATSARVVVLTIAIVLLGARAASTAATPALPRHAVLGAAARAAPSGVSVVNVIPHTAAEEARLRTQDVITKIDGTSIDTIATFLSTVRSKAAGATIDVAVLRDGKPLTLRVTLKPAPDEHVAGMRTSYEALRVDGTLRRTLVSVPANAHARLPAVLLIGGIGCYSVDVATNPEDGYARTMQDVTRAGFLTMRLEKSGVGDSQGPPCHDVGFNDESRSYALALAALRADRRVDPRRVYLLGHSIGSAIAPRLATEQRVAGIVVADGFARDWFEYEMANLRRALELGDDAANVVDATLVNKATCMYRLFYEKTPQAEVERADPECKERDAVYPVAMNYVREVAAANIVEPWTRLGVPVLVLYGSSDFVIDPADHRRIVSIVNAHHSGNASLQVIEGMAHGLGLAATQKIAMNDFETGTPERYDTDFGKAIVAWLCNRERCARS